MVAMTKTLNWENVETKSEQNFLKWLNNFIATKIIFNPYINKNNCICIIKSWFQWWSLFINATVILKFWQAVPS